MQLKAGAIFLLSALFVCLVAYDSQACTAFSIKKGDTVFYGENFDWHVKHGLVVVNKRGVKKTPQVFGANDQKIASWVSKYGSITFNILGREYLHSGMNSKGLFVTGLILRHSQYQSKDSRPVVTNSQYKQYFLDNCATVKEVMSVQSKIRVYPRNQNNSVHFFVSDITGQCAVIEYLDGKMVVHEGDSLTVNVLSNSEYAYAVDYLKEHKGFGGDKAVYKTRTHSLDRFVCAAEMVQSYQSKPSAFSVDSGFNILASVAQNSTAWRIVYDASNMQIHVRTIMNTKLQTIDMKSFDFSCDTPPLVLDLNNTLSGDVSRHFRTYTQDVNKAFIMRVTDFYRLPENISNALVTHQYGMSCAQDEQLKNNKGEVYEIHN